MFVSFTKQTVIKKTNFKKEKKNIIEGRLFFQPVGGVTESQILVSPCESKMTQSCKHQIKYALSSMIGRRRYLSHSIIRLLGQEWGLKQTLEWAISH